MHKRFKAFTLIELLVVIAIVGILTGFIFVSMNGAVTSAQDAKRKADLSSIQKALLMYQSTGHVLPSSCDTSSGSCLSELSEYLKVVPDDSDSSKSYVYTLIDSSNFKIQATLSNNKTYYYSTTNGWSETSSPYVAWIKNKTVTISNSGSALTNYQVNLTVTYDSDMQADFDDLRFTTSSGTALNYYVESYVASTSAVVWVKVPTINNPSTDIIMYYGNPTAASESSGNTVFEFFDHFDSGTIDSGKWTKDYSNGSRSLLSSILTITGGAGTSTSYQEDMRTNTTWDNGYATIIYASLSGNDCRLGFPNPRGFFVRGAVWGNFSGTYGCRIYASNWASFSEVTYGTGYTGYKRFEYRRVSDTQFYTYVNGTQIYNDTLKTPFSYNGGVTLAVVNSGSIAVDWVIVRKCASTEPTSSFGTEQNNS